MLRTLPLHCLPNVSLFRLRFTASTVSVLSLVHFRLSSCSLLFELHTRLPLYFSSISSHLTLPCPLSACTCTFPNQLLHDQLWICTFPARLLHSLQMLSHHLMAIKCHYQHHRYGLVQGWLTLVLESHSPACF